MADPKEDEVTKKTIVLPAVACLDVDFYCPICIEDNQTVELQLDGNSQSCPICEYARVV